MLVMAMKKEYIELKKMIEKRLEQNIDDDTRAELKQKLLKVDWVISEMDRLKLEMQEMEI